MRDSCNEVRWLRQRLGDCPPWAFCPHHHLRGSVDPADGTAGAV